MDRKKFEQGCRQLIYCVIDCKDILATQEIYKYENPDLLFSHLSHDLVNLYDMYLIEIVDVKLQ